MKFPNKYLRNLKPYNVASHKIWTIDPEERKSVLKLDWNEATVSPSPKVMELLQKKLQEPVFFNLYPATYNEELMSALSSYLSLPQENIQYFASSDALHEYICKVFISVGDPVLILGPSYDNFRLTCQAAGADVFYFYYNDDFSFDAGRFEREIADKEPAVVYLCNPNNPTGYFHAIDYIRHLLDSFPDTLFLVDEAYIEFSGNSSKDLVLDYDNILISRTMSKAFALANFRFGYLIASKDNIRFINKVRNPKNISTFSQVAALGALLDPGYMLAYVKEVNLAKQMFIDEMKGFDKVSIPTFSYGNFLLVKFSDYADKMQMIEFLSKRNIFVRNREDSPAVMNCFRITIGTRLQMQRVLQAFADYYDRAE